MAVGSMHFDKRGSALVTAIIATVLLSVICVGFLNVVIVERNLATRSHINNALINLAEAGLEEGIWAINNADWSSWELLNFDQDAYLSRTAVNLGDDATLEFHVIVQSRASSPLIYSEAIATFANGSTMSKQLRVTYQVSANKPGGLIAKGKIDMSGEPKIDSYDSSLGSPSFSNRSDSVIVGTMSSDSDALKLSGDVYIYGYTGTGSELPDISGPNNRIRGADSPAGNIDWSHVSQDFNFDFPAIEQPNWSGALTSLPSESGTVILVGDPLAVTPTRYSLSALSLSGQTEVQIIGPVQLYLSDGLSISGQARINIQGVGSIEIYSPKDFSISGQGIVNDTSIPDNFQIFGTASTAGDQSFSLSGQGLMEFLFYGPNANASISGQGEIAGSIVANEITYSGQGEFHYDVTIGGGGNEGEGLSSWHELAKAEHQLDFDDYVAAN